MDIFAIIQLTIVIPIMSKHGILESSDHGHALKAKQNTLLKVLQMEEENWEIWEQKNNRNRFSSCLTASRAPGMILAGNIMLRKKLAHPKSPGSSPRRRTTQFWKLGHTVKSAHVYILAFALSFL